MRMGREAVFWTATLAGAAFLVAAAILFAASRDLFDSEVFGARAEQSLADPGVGAYTAELLTRSVIRAQPDLVAVRPLLLATAHGIVATRPFQVLVGQAARKAHRALFAEGTRQLLLSLPDLQVLLRETLSQASPQLGARIPKQVETVVASPGTTRGAEAVVRVWRQGRHIRWGWQLLFPLGMLLFATGIWQARNHRRAMVRAGFALVAAGLVLLAVPHAGGLAGLVVEDPLEQGLIRGLWRSYWADLQDWGLLYAGLGLVLAAGAASLLETADPVARARELGALLIRVPVRPARRLAWATAMSLWGALLIARPLQMLAVGVILTGVCAAFLGVRELFRLLLQRLPQPVELEQAGGPTWRPAVAVVASAGLLIAAAWAIWRNPVDAPERSTVAVCNGHAELCGRRVEEVVFAGTHNAMSHQQVTDWMFPHQQAGIGRQLDDGIRALLFDVHYGFPGGSRIKTDMSQEPMAAKIREAIGGDGYQAAMRIRDRLVGVEERRRGLYVCHGLCELGAYPFESALREIHDFLVAHPDEVLLLVLEDAAEPRDIAKGFAESGLAEYVYKGKGGPRWPTLREMIADGGRVAVFLESGRPGVDWLRPAFSEMRETPYAFHSPEEFSCQPNRGGDAGALFLLNHWIETTPAPKPSNAALVNRYDVLQARLKRCETERARKPNIVAVDFYQTGDLLRMVNERNGVTSSP